VVHHFDEDTYKKAIAEDMNELVEELDLQLAELERKKFFEPVVVLEKDIFLEYDFEPDCLGTKEEQFLHYQTSKSAIAIDHSNDIDTFIMEQLIYSNFIARYFVEVHE